jgi:NAD(P)-dependent dehydrogenase (short-subunit alcohol dehydrogenase family)
VSEQTSNGYSTLDPGEKIMSQHPVLNATNVAIVTGASDLGFAAAKRLAASGLKVYIADPESPRLEAAIAEVAAVSSRRAVPTDVSKLAEPRQFGASTCAPFGVVVSVIGAMIIGSSSAAMARDTVSSHPPDEVINTACLPWQAPIATANPELQTFPAISR